MDLNTKKRSDYVYPINVFQELTSDGFDYTLSEKVLNIINRIATKVGAPNYVKTPIFQKKQSKRSNRRKRSNNKGKELTDEEWEAFRTFEKTTYEKKTDGVYKVIGNIYGLLNKLTDSNYKDIYDDITEQIDGVITEMKDEDLLKIANQIFDVASSNSFYSAVYAKLYREISMKYPVFKTTFNVAYENINSILENLESCDESNYEELCRINKVNDRRKALVSFIVNSAKEELIESSSIYKVMNNFITMFEENIDVEDKTLICEELSEIIYIMFEHGFDVFKSCEDFETLWEKVTGLADLNTKQHISLTNKSAFKLMDIVDEYEDEV